VSYLPGGLATGSVSYHACFNDTPAGLETHVYAPLGLDIRGKWSVGGTLPGEPQQPEEEDVKTPKNCIYIREDVKMTCSSLLMGFVKRTFKDSHADLVEKLVERAHNLESSFANERLQALRNVEPGERMAIGDIFIAPPPDYRHPSAASSQPNLPQLPLAPLQPSSSAPAPLVFHRPQTQPQPQSQAAEPQQHTAPRTLTQHSRSHSDPVTSPGFFHASTLWSDTHSPPPPPSNSKPQSQQQPGTSRPFALALIDLPSPMLERHTYKLPTTTYQLPTTSFDGGLSQHKDWNRPISFYPGGPQYMHRRNESELSAVAPRVFYSPDERAISFTFPPHEGASSSSSSAYTRSHNHSESESSRSSDLSLLEEIDDAIDEVFLYAGSPSPRRDVAMEAKLEPVKVEWKQEPVKVEQQPELVLLPSTTYNPAHVPKKKHTHARKDSVVPEILSPSVFPSPPRFPLSATASPQQLPVRISPVSPVVPEILSPSVFPSPPHFPPPATAPPKQISPVSSKDSAAPDVLFPNVYPSPHQNPVSIGPVSRGVSPARAKTVKQRCLEKELPPIPLGQD
jgi:hypothetical protein